MGTESMTRQKYIPIDNKWIAFVEFDTQQFGEAVYSDLGARFPLSINNDGTVLLDPDDLPAGVSENDAKQAIRDNHPHR